MDGICPNCSCEVPFFDGQEVALCPRCGRELSADELDDASAEQTRKFVPPTFLTIGISLVAPGVLMLLALLQARLFSSILTWIPILAQLQIFFLGIVVSGLSSLHVAYQLGDRFGGVGRLAGIALCPVILVGNFILMIMTSSAVR